MIEKYDAKEEEEMKQTEDKISFFPSNRASPKPKVAANIETIGIKRTNGKPYGGTMSLEALKKQ